MSEVQMQGSMHLLKPPIERHIHPAAPSYMGITVLGLCLCYMMCLWMQIHSVFATHFQPEHTVPKFPIIFGALFALPCLCSLHASEFLRQVSAYPKAEVALPKLRRAVQQRKGPCRTHNRGPPDWRSRLIARRKRWKPVRIKVCQWCSDIDSISYSIWRCRICKI